MTGEAILCGMAGLRFQARKERKEAGNLFGDDPGVTRTIFQALAVCLGLQPTSPEASVRILRAYADPPPPQSARDRALCFYHLTPDPSAQMISEWTVVDRVYAVYRFIPCILNLVFYGAGAETNALLVRENLFLDGANHPRSILRKAGIYPSRPRNTPAVIWEEEDSLYRKRADLVIPLRLLDNSDEASSGDQHPIPADPVEVAPEVVIHKR